MTAEPAPFNPDPSTLTAGLSRALAHTHSLRDCSLRLHSFLSSLPLHLPSPQPSRLTPLSFNRVSRYDHPLQPHPVPSWPPSPSLFLSLPSHPFPSLSFPSLLPLPLFPRTPALWPCWALHTHLDSHALSARGQHTPHTEQRGKRLLTSHLKGHLKGHLKSHLKSHLLLSHASQRWKGEEAAHVFQTFILSRVGSGRHLTRERERASGRERERERETHLRQTERDTLLSPPLGAQTPFWLYQNPIFFATWPRCARA